MKEALFVALAAMLVYGVVLVGQLVLYIVDRVVEVIENL